MHVEQYEIEIFGGKAGKRLMTIDGLDDVHLERPQNKPGDLPVDGMIVNQQHPQVADIGHTVCRSGRRQQALSDHALR